MTGTQQTDLGNCACGLRATHAGKRCERCYEEDMAIIAAELQEEPAMEMHVGNPHPTTPQSERNYNGLTDDMYIDD